MASMKEMAAMRQRMVDTVKDLQQVRMDVKREGDEAILAATGAVVWACVLMVCEILKTGISAADPKFAVGFKVLDTAIAGADRLLQLFGSRPMAKKAELLKQVDPNLLQAVKVIDHLRTARDAIKEISGKVPVLNMTPQSAAQIDLVLEIALDMGDSTILLMQTCQVHLRASSMTRIARSQIDRHIVHLTKQIMRIDREFDHSLFQYTKMQNIV